jgi:hypothetical protein
MVAAPFWDLTASGVLGGVSSLFGEGGVLGGDGGPVTSGAPIQASNTGDFNVGAFASGGATQEVSGGQVGSTGSRGGPQQTSTPTVTGDGGQPVYSPGGGVAGGGMVGMGSPLMLVLIGMGALVLGLAVGRR